MGYWSGKVVAITGGAAGLGRRLASHFALAGAQLVLVDRDEPPLSQAVEQLHASTERVEGVTADVTSQRDVDALFQAIDTQFGGLDAFVNCAGRSARGAVLDTTVEDFDRLLALNFYGTMRCARCAVPRLVERRGHLVNMGSLAAKMAARYLGAYPVSKFAVAAYSQQLRLEWGPRGLHVLLVCPGPIARPDAGHRYADQTAGLPAAAQRPGGGVRLKGIDPDYLADRILRSCRRRQPDLVVPFKARLLASLCQLAPSLGDRIISRMTE